MIHNPLADARSAASRGDPRAFVRGHFLALEARGIPAAILHGWEDGFAGVLGDVDFVLSADHFGRLAAEVARHARESGWRLCQVLRHESTAAFCVCSWCGDPARVVALDGCSDYRRRERVLMAADGLLAGRVRLEWGGHRLGAGTELRYRFLKAAVKGKSAEQFAPALAAYPEAARTELAEWLRRRWAVELGGWDAASVGLAWEALARRTLEEPLGGRWAALRRIVWRLSRPTGLVVAGADADQAEAVTKAFGRLYFRRTASTSRFRAGGWRQLIASTLLCCGRVGWGWRALLGRDLLVDAGREETPTALVGRIAAMLEARCARRERLGVGSR